MPSGAWHNAMRAFDSNLQKDSGMLQKLLVMMAALTVSSTVFAQIADDFNTDDSTGTSSATFGSNFWSELKYKFSMHHFAFTSANMVQANEGASRLESYNYLAFDYKFTKTKKISIRPVYQVGTAGTNYRDDYQAGDFKLGDAFINIVDYDFLDLPYDVEVKAGWRIYAPTSKDSQARGMITRIRPEFEITRRLTRDLEFVALLEPDYYVQGRTSYLNERGYANGNRKYGYESKAGLRYRFNRWVGAAAGFGHDQMWHYTSEANGLNETFTLENITAEASMSLSLGDVFLVAGLSQKRNVLRPREDMGLFTPSESDYFLLSDIRF